MLLLVYTNSSSSSTWEGKWGKKMKVLPASLHQLLSVASIFPARNNLWRLISYLQKKRLPLCLLSVHQPVPACGAVLHDKQFRVNIFFALWMRHNILCKVRGKDWQGCFLSVNEQAGFIVRNNIVQGRIRASHSFLTIISQQNLHFPCILFSLPLFDFSIFSSLFRSHSIWWQIKHGKMLFLSLIIFSKSFIYQMLLEEVFCSVC